MCMHEETKKNSTFNDVPVLLANIDEKLSVIVEWIRSGACQKDPHAILTIDEAVAFTGYSKSAIHSATSKDTIPHFKRGNKLFFFKDELVKWLKSDSRPKRGKRFQDKDKPKESFVTDGNEESVSIAAGTTNDTNSVARVADANSNQSEKATSVPEEAVSACQSPEISTPSAAVTNAELEPNGSDDDSKGTSAEPTPKSGTEVESYMDRREDVLLSVCEKMTHSNESLPDEHLSNDSVKRQGKENSISFLYFSLERQEATDGNPAKSVIRFFDKIPREHYYTVCKIAEDRHGKRVVNNTVSFEFAIYDDALQAALSIDKYLSPGSANSTSTDSN